MNEQLLGILMIVGGLALASGGVVVLGRRGTESPAKVESSSIRVPDEGAGALTPEEKGKKFEEWVVKRLSRDYFTIKEWRGDKYVDGIYAQSSTNPDLEIEFHMRDTRKTFAIECKWRRGYDTGEKPYIVWASDRQIENYRGFAQSKNQPVFVIIGVGGEHDDPAEVFVVNLDRLRYSKATAEYLARFRRTNKAQNLYYDHKKLELR